MPARLFDFGPFITDRHNFKALTDEELREGTTDVFQEISILRKDIYNHYPDGMNEGQSETAYWITERLSKMRIQTKRYLANNNIWI
jgi:hypothetical protein